MRYLRFTLPAVFLFAAVPYAAVTQSGPQTTRPAATSGQTAPVRTAGAPQAPPPAVAAGERNVPAVGRELEELRQTLWRDVLGQYPASVGRSIQLSPPLISQDDFLARYPALETFLKEHPEVRMNQGYFFPPLPREDRGDSGVAMAIIPLSFSALIFGVVYLFHQRSRAALQARQETTAKLVDGLLAREDLLSQLETPAGRRLLGSLTQRPEPAPAARIITSIQIGSVLTFLGLGFGALRLLFVNEAENRLEFATAATVLATIGVGVLVSAGASYLLSRRFGLIQTPGNRD